MPWQTLNTVLYAKSSSLLPAMVVVQCRMQNTTVQHTMSLGTGLWQKRMSTVPVCAKSLQRAYFRLLVMKIAPQSKYYWNMGELYEINRNRNSVYIHVRSRPDSVFFQILAFTNHLLIYLLTYLLKLLVTFFSTAKTVVDSDLFLHLPLSWVIN